jgi:hypothetical protein
MMMKYFEGLTRAVERAREPLGQHVLGAVGRAMEHQDGLARGLSDGRVAHPHLGHDLAGMEGEVLDDVLAGFGSGKSAAYAATATAISAAETSAPCAILHIRMSDSPYCRR